MLDKLLSGNIPVPAPAQVTLSPFAALARVLVLQGFPPGSTGRTDVAPPAPVPDPAVSPSDRARACDEAPSEPVIPAFAYLFPEEDSIMPAASKLMLFLPQDDSRPHPVRVVERSACKVKWYAIETWHDNVQRWVDRDTAPKKAAAMEKARDMAWLATADCE